MKIALYLRVSSDVQETFRQKSDLTAQAIKDGCEIVHIFSDKESGIKEERKGEGLAKLRKLTKEDVDAVYITELSRLSRDPLQLKILIKEFFDKGINIYFHVQNINTIDKNGESNFISNMLIGMLSEYSAYEIQLKNKRVKSGKKEAVYEKGNSYTIKPAFGYKIEEKKLLINEEEAEIVKQLFNKYAAGEGTKDLLQYMNLNKFPTRNTDFIKKSTYKVNGTTTMDKKDIKWCKSSIREILKNTVYCGYKVRFDGVKIDTPAIVSEDLFNKCQKARQTNDVRGDKSKKHDYMLRGIFICGECGKQMIGHISHQEIVYRCADKTAKKRNTFTGCNNASIFKNYMEDMLWKSIKDIYQRLRTDQVKKGNINSVNENIVECTSQISLIEKEIKKLEEKSRKLLSLYLNNIYTENELNTEKSILNEEVESLSKQLKKLIDLRSDRISTLKAIEKMEEHPFNLEEVEKSYHLQKEAVREILKEVLIYKIDNKYTVFQIYFKAGYTLNIIRETWSKKYIVVDSYSLTFNPVTKLFQNNNQVEVNDFGEIGLCSTTYQYKPEELFRNYSNYPELMELGLP